jgi:RimJ/RimL family protein N-acetyltransferase
MKANIWQETLVRLRAVEPEDWAAFFAWGDDTEGSRRSYQIPFPSSAEARRQAATELSTRGVSDDAFRFVVENLAGEFVGTINTHTCDRRHGTFRYGLGIRTEHQRRGYASEAIRIVLRYFFDELRYQKVTAAVYSFNAPSIALHERLGLVLEGRLRREVYTAGRYHDILLFGLTAEEFAARHGATAVPVGE